MIDKSVSIDSIVNDNKNDIEAVRYGEIDWRNRLYAIEEDNKECKIDVENLRYNLNQ